MENDNYIELRKSGGTGETGLSFVRTDESGTKSFYGLFDYGNDYEKFMDIKADKNHASTTTEYGVGSALNYGHCKTINNLSRSSYVNGEALSAYQGYLINNGLTNYNNYMSKKIYMVHGNDLENTGYRYVNLYFDTDSGHVAFLYIDAGEVSIITINIVTQTTGLNANSVHMEKLFSNSRTIDSIQGSRNSATSNRYRIKLHFVKNIPSYDIMVLGGNISNLVLQLVQS